MTSTSKNRIAWGAFATASIILALDPLAWLLRSWTSYAVEGSIYFLLLLGLVITSLLSGAPRPKDGDVPVLPLLLFAAALRLLGQVLAINTLSAFALAVDVFAVVYLLKLDSRPFALSPVWMAALFMFALPIQHLIERTAGFPLQMISADGACQLLGIVFSDVTCQGTRLTVAGEDVLIDLPCSGSTGLMLMMALIVTMNAIYRPRLPMALIGIIATVCLAIAGNTLRVTLLSSGIALRDRLPIDVMLDPWHSAIGLSTLALSALPLLLWYRPKSVVPAIRWRGFTAMHLSPSAKLPIAIMTIPIAIAITDATERPVDRSGPVAKRAMPMQIAGHPGKSVPLSTMERVYFEQHGGHAEKAVFGQLGINIVSTRMPLRHLHSPVACLKGLGYRVQFQGTRFDGHLPSAVYLAWTEDEAWSVAVSYVSDQGQIANGVAEAIWQWIQKPGATWSSIQRLTPASMPDDLRRTKDRAVLAALDIPLSPTPLPR